MKKLFTLFAIVITTVAMHAQTANAVVFSEDGDKFTLILNGEKKNEIPQVNVKVSGLTSTFYTAKIDFENSAILDITSKNFAVEMGNEATYVIKKNKKGEYVMRFHSYAPIGSTAANPNSDSGISTETRRIAEVDDHYTEATPSSSESQSVRQTVTTPGGNVNTDVVITETTTSKTTGKPANGENINVGMNVGGVSMGINMNVSGMDVEENSSTTVTTTTTTKTSSSGSTNTASNQTMAKQPRQDVVIREEATPCGVGMSSSSFATAKKSIADKGFDDTRLTVAKQVTKSNCLNVNQIKEIMGVFGFEETRLEYAKFAYDRCTNPGDYYLINDSFSFSSTIDELNKYIESK